MPVETARRRRERLAELIEALGAARGQRVTQREFAASIGREQGTVAAILGGDRALGADVMMAVVQAYRLPSDWFDRALRPDPRPFARAALGLAGGSFATAPSPGAGPRGEAQAIPAIAPAIAPPEQAIPPIASAIHDGTQAIPAIAQGEGGRATSDAALAETLAALGPDRSVSIALEALARRGLREDGLGWERLTIGAQSAQDLGILVRWFDETLAARATTATATATGDGAESYAPPLPRARARS